MGRPLWLPEEYAKAAALYASLRLLRLRTMVAADIERWTGLVPGDEGSFGLRLNLVTSDLDLGIGYPPEDHERIMRALRSHGVFKGERMNQLYHDTAGTPKTVGPPRQVNSRPLCLPDSYQVRAVGIR